MNEHDTIDKVRRAMTKCICLKDAVNALAEYTKLNNTQGASLKDKLVNAVKILLLDRNFPGLLKLIQQTSEKVLCEWAGLNTADCTYTVDCT